MATAHQVAAPGVAGLEQAEGSNNSAPIPGRGKESAASVHGAGITSVDSARTRSSSAGGSDCAPSETADAELMVSSVEEMQTDRAEDDIEAGEVIEEEVDMDHSMSFSSSGYNPGNEDTNTSSAFSSNDMPLFELSNKSRRTEIKESSSASAAVADRMDVATDAAAQRQQGNSNSSSTAADRMHAPGLMFPSPRKEGAPLPPTYVMSIQEGGVVPITQREVTDNLVGPKAEQQLEESAVLKAEPASSSVPSNVVPPPPATASASSTDPSSEATAGVPLMPVKTYPYPEIRTSHSATFRPPHALPEPSSASSAAIHPPEEATEKSVAPPSSSIPSAQPGATPPPLPPQPSLTFSTPSKKELAPRVLSGMPNATEVQWERHPAAGQIRHPLGVPAPSLDEDESETPQPPILPFRRQESERSHADSPMQYASGVRKSDSSSSLSAATVSSTASPPESDDDGDMYQCRPHGASSQTWELFESLVNEAGHGSRKMERQRERSYNCPWYRIGYYRRCEDKYKDPAVYDSEDSEYEEPERAVSRGAHGPFSTDFGEVRAMMLEIDALADRPVPGGVPKYFRDWGKKLRRRDTLRQQRLRREREREDREIDGVAYRPSGGKIKGDGVNRSSSGKSGGGSKGVKKQRIPGMPAPKRQSTALTLSYELQANGLIRCKRCGKKNFKNEFALRSHLSHCPGTIHMKEQRMKIEAGIISADAPMVLAIEDMECVSELPAWVPAFSGSGTSSTLGAPHSRGGGSVGHAMMDHDTKLSASAVYRDDCDSPGRLRADSMDSPIPPPPPVFEGTPLVPDTVEDGDSLIDRTISFRNRLVHDWTDAIVRNYRSRRNTHLIVYSDSTAEWVILTERNCRLEPGYRGSGSGSQLGSDNENGSLNGSDPYSRMRSDSFTGSGDEYNSKRRSNRLGDIPTSSSLGLGVAPSGTDSERNAFFNQHESLITPRRPTKRKSDCGDDSNSASGSDLSASDNKVMRPGGPSGHSHHHHFHPIPQHPYAHKAGKAISPYTGMAISSSQAAASGHIALSSFACRRCNHAFHNKQALGWHTRKGCLGAQPLPASSSSGSTGVSSSASASSSGPMGGGGVY